MNHLNLIHHDETHIFYILFHARGYIIILEVIYRGCVLVRLKSKVKFENLVLIPQVISVPSDFFEKFEKKTVKKWSKI
jgi:hypothetical protein